MKRTSIQLKEDLEKVYNYFRVNDITIKNCSLLFNIDRHILSKYLKTKGVKINPNNKQNINSNIFKRINSEEKAYWLGFLYADGNVSSDERNTISLELSIKDLNHLEKFNTFLEKSLPIRIENNRVRCIFQDKSIKEDLIKLGCIPNKSLLLKFPTTNQVSKKYIKHFIRGYIDGDGSIYVSNNNINITVLGTKEFLNSLVENINFPKRNLYKNNKNNNSNCYFFQYSGVNASKLIEMLYKDSEIHLERKYDKYLKYGQ